MKNYLHQGAKWLFRFQGYFTFGILGLFLWIWGVAPFSAYIFNSLHISGSLGLSILVLEYIVSVIILSEIYAQLSYNNWFYEFTQEGIKIEKGIIYKKYSFIPYERIQNIDVYRGIAARMLGFSSIMIQTAGYAKPVPEGYIPAVDVNQAERIREFVIKKIEESNNKQGL